VVAPGRGDLLVPNGIAIWNRVYRALALGQGLDIVDSARLFAMTNLAGADASIAGTTMRSTASGGPSRRSGGVE
jgi:hypothetical protein